jgi:hypothetical protein
MEGKMGPVAWNPWRCIKSATAADTEGVREYRQWRAEQRQRRIGAAEKAQYRGTRGGA